ncbi:MAG: cupin domain-containing protein [Anaerolineales bacterium]|nr:cupin domain-containing protein [Anaerolineales bacterium]
MARKPVKVSPYDVEPIRLNERTNFKLIDPTTVESQHLTFGMVSVDPGGICEPGHAHDEQEEIFFCLNGRGIVYIGEKREPWEIAPKDAIFIPPGTYHNLENPHATPLEVLWIQSPAGWVFDKHPDLKEKAARGEA